MRKLSRILALGSILLFTAPTAKAQAIKTNLPLLLAGTPNVGVEFMLSQQFTMNADILWMPYMFKKHEEVFRALIGSVDMRYYVKPRYYYTNNMYDGFYLGPYVAGGNFNIGLWQGEDKESYRRKGWGLSAGISLETFSPRSESRHRIRPPAIRQIPARRRVERICTGIKKHARMVRADKIRNPPDLQHLQIIGQHKLRL